MRDPRYWLWLSLIFKTGSAFCDSLLHAFNHNPRSIYEADKTALLPFCKNNDVILSRLLDKRLDRVYSVLDFCERENIGILSPENKNFPSPLLKIEGQPLVLYYKGRLPDFARAFGVAVVGTRSVTPYGSSAAYTISHDLASAGAVVVSGMALGADTAAHRGALDAGGHTVAFLGCGIDIVYPKDNLRLMQEICSRGTVITEYAPGLPPEGRHFPVRNRLISGVSSAVLVIEAAEKSGALITASHGLKQGKLIYAVPGKVGELSSTGTNLLIRNGAKMVTSAKDIISDFSGLYDFRFTQGNKAPKQNYTDQSRKSESVPSYKTEPELNSNAAPETRSEAESTQIFKAENTASTVFSEKMQNNAFSETHRGKPFETVPEFNRQSQNGAFTQTDPSRSRDLGNAVLINEQRSTSLIAAQPRPTILYNGMTEEEVAASYMSMETEIRGKKEIFPENVERVYLTYPKEPMPENGYEINLTEEGLRTFDQSSEFNFRTAFSETDRVFPVASYKSENDPIADAVKKQAEKKKRISFRRIKSQDDVTESETSSKNKRTDKTKNSVKPVNGDSSEKSETKKTISYEGLNETETEILKFIFEHQPVGIDGMSSLGIPVSQLLSTVTILEIKQKISQKPGGYFEIKQ